MGVLIIQRLFNIAGLSVTPIWILCILFPTWHVTRSIMSSMGIIAVPVLVYCFIAVPRLKSLTLLLIQGKVFERFVAAMATPGGAVLMWAHVSAFDLFVGRHIYLETIDKPISWFVVGPILLITMIAGPVGLGLYWMLVGFLSLSGS